MRVPSLGAADIGGVDAFFDWRAVVETMLMMPFGTVASARK
jgi:hypothetical protein